MWFVWAYSSCICNVYVMATHWLHVGAKYVSLIYYFIIWWNFFLWFLYHLWPKVLCSLSPLAFMAHCCQFFFFNLRGLSLQFLSCMSVCRLIIYLVSYLSLACWQTTKFTSKFSNHYANIKYVSQVFSSSDMPNVSHWQWLDLNLHVPSTYW